MQVENLRFHPDVGNEDERRFQTAPTKCWPVTPAVGAVGGPGGRLPDDVAALKQELILMADLLYHLTTIVYEGQSQRLRQLYVNRWCGKNGRASGYTLPAVSAEIPGQAARPSPPFNCWTYSWGDRPTPPISATTARTRPGFLHTGKRSWRVGSKSLCPIT